jgi:hypothetical protein
MLKIKIITAFLMACSLSACGQINKNHQYQKIAALETNKITHPVAKADIEAWQLGDSKKF